MTVGPSDGKFIPSSRILYLAKCGKLQCGGGCRREESGFKNISTLYLSFSVSLSLYLKCVKQQCGGCRREESGFKNISTLYLSFSVSLSLYLKCVKQQCGGCRREESG